MTGRKTTGKFDYERLDEVIHGRMRLGVFAYLSAVESASFVELRAALNATAGNVSSNLAKLESAGYIRIGKSFLNKRPLTTVALTESGRSAWTTYLKQMASLLESRPAAEKQVLSRKSGRGS